MYLKDYDGQFFPNHKHTPPLVISRFISDERRGWTREVRGHGASDGLFLCLSNTAQHTNYDKGYTAYWFNENLAGISTRHLDHPSRTFLFGEGSDGIDKADVTYSLRKFPETWLNDETKPPFRHIGGANYAFADGHVAWLRPQQVSHFRW